MAMPRLLCLGAHPDDLALSIGGALLQLRGRARLHCVAVFGETLWSRSGLHQSKEAISLERATEDARWRRAVGASGGVMALPDTSCRGLSTYQETRCVNDLELWVDRARQVVHHAASTFAPHCTLAPLALGGHADHIILRQACRAEEKRLGHLCFYEDLPYAFKRSDTERIAVSIGAARNAAIDITEHLQHKLALLQIYSSQMTPEYRVAVRRHSASLSSGGAVERLWSRRALPLWLRPSPRTDRTTRQL